MKLLEGLMSEEILEKLKCWSLLPTTHTSLQVRIESC